jgi:hypothetical protein
VTLFLPLVLIGPVMLLAVALLTVGAYGPLGWAADVVLLLALGWTAKRLWRVTAAWWRSTKAPVLPYREDAVAHRQ